MRLIFVFSYILCCFIGCSSNTCGEQATFTVGPEGGTYEYCNWKFVIPPDAVSKTTTFTVQKSNTVSVKNIASISECICTNGTDTTATPIVGLDKHLGEPVYLAAAGTDWSDSWNRLLNNSVELYNKYISSYTVVDPCVICSYGGFQLDSYLTGSDCQNFIKDQICSVTLPIVATSLPLVLIPPLKQGICAAAKAAISGIIDFATSKVSEPKIGTICDLFDSSTSLTIPEPLVRDGFGCIFQKSCDVITNCSAKSLTSKWIASS